MWIKPLIILILSYYKISVINCEQVSEIANLEQSSFSDLLTRLTGLTRLAGRSRSPRSRSDIPIEDEDVVGYRDMDEEIKQDLNRFEDIKQVKS